MKPIPQNVRALLPAVASALDEGARCSLAGDPEGAGKAHERAMWALALYVLQFFLGCAAVVLVGWAVIRWLR